jgi:hypothetical protein
MYQQIAVGPRRQIDEGILQHGRDLPVPGAARSPDKTEQGLFTIPHDSMAFEVVRSALTSGAMRCG